MSECLKVFAEIVPSSLSVATEFFIAHPVVQLNLAIALFVELAGFETLLDIAAVTIG